ncbi:MAG TPA: DUF805 domain-containing protein, partial [Pseudomonadales bacterium]|nr:DUF805 domain-containing protein [Pseudomonadales bacterium]
LSFSVRFNVPENPYQTPHSVLNQELVRWSPSLTQILFSFDGRIRRLTYWLCTFALSCAGGIFSYFANALQLYQLPQPDLLVELLTLAFGVAVIWISFAIQIKRWHDRNKSGWWCLIVLIPVIGTIWAFIELGLLGGNAGSNEFGPPQA